MNVVSRLVSRDPESVALRRLAGLRAVDRPLDALEQVAHLARELTGARYAALVITDGEDEVEGFVTSGLTVGEERKLKAAPQGHGPLGTMRQDGLAVHIDNLDEQEKSFGFPPRHPDMKTLLGVPLWVRGAVRGALYATDHDGGNPFRAVDEVTLNVLARHAGHIIATRWY